MLEDFLAPTVAVNAGEIAHVIAVGFQPAEHRILSVEEPILRASRARGERTVVTYFIGAAGICSRSPNIKAVAAVGIVSLPGRIRGLEQQLGADLVRAYVIAYDKDDMAGAPYPP